MIKIKKIKKYFKKIVWFIAKNHVSVFFFLFFLALILGGFAFYKYSFLAEKSEPQATTQPLEFKESLYQEILGEWEERQKNFEETGLKEYPNVFQPKLVIPKETEELTK